MACSKPMRLKDVYDITRTNSVLFDFLRSHNVLFSFDGLCDRCADGHMHLVHDSSVSDGLKWRCTNRRCNFKMSLRMHSFFSASHLSISVITEIIYLWVHKCSQEFVMHETGISKRTMVDFYNFLREVCSVILQEHSEPIGGPGKIVEIDESKFGKRKYNKGRRVDGVWVFGGIERDSDPPKTFFVPVSDRSAATLIPIIKRWILPGTTVLSDCWKAYSSLEREGFIHETVNHSVHFVSDSGTHTNTIESTWNALKKSLPKFGTAKDMYNSYFAEYCIRHKYINVANDKFLEILRLISLVYNPTRANSNENDASAQPSHGELSHDELLPPRMETASHSDSENNMNVDNTVTFAACDVGNFDLQFDFNDFDSDVDIFE